MRMRNKVLVSHIDLDGYGCNIMARRFLHDVMDMYNVNYDDLADCLCLISRDVHLIITDLSIPENLEGLIREFDTVTIIDHHVSTMWAIDAFAGDSNIEAHVDRRRCATWLFCDWMAERGYISEEPDEVDWMERWRTYIDDYDRYILQHEESERLNALLYTSNRDRFVSDAIYQKPEDMLSNNRQRIDRYLQTQNEYVEASQPILLADTIDGPFNIYAVFAEKYKSKIAQGLMRGKGADLVYLLDMHTGQMSIRSSKESRIDCSKLARMIDPEGGGHRNASGCRMVPNNSEGEGQAMIGVSLPIEDIPTYGSDDED